LPLLKVITLRVVGGLAGVPVGGRAKRGSRNS
jgi:hypothetical protein